MRSISARLLLEVRVVDEATQPVHQLAEHFGAVYVYPFGVYLGGFGASAGFQQAGRPVEVCALGYIQDGHNVDEIALQRRAHDEVAECLRGGCRAGSGILGFARAKLGECALEQVVLGTKRGEELHERVAVFDSRAPFAAPSAIIGTRSLTNT